MTATPSLSDVLAAVRAGAGSAAEVARRTGSTPEVADTALAALAAAGRIHRVIVLAGGCPDGGCRSCGTAARCAAAGIGPLVGSGLTAWRVVER